MLVKSESTSKLSSANVLSGSQFLLSNKMYFRGSYFRNILFALMICHTDCVVMQNVLLTTLHFSQPSLVLQYHHQILVKTKLKWRSGLANGKCRLIQIDKTSTENYFFLKEKWWKAIQVYTLIKHEYNDNLLKNILVSY